QAKPHDLLVVDGDEECGNHHQQQPDQEAGQGGGERGGHGHTAHQYDGETGDQLPQHIEQLGLQLLQRGHEGGVQLGQQLLQPGEKVSELRENIGGIERGNLLHHRCDSGRDPDSRQRQQQADGAVCEDHQQYRHQPLGRVEHPGEEADGAAQNIGDQKRQDE
ncbi:2-C-methyl-D-erythritol 2,4-cyclodiphosphate synthase, partial [Dysosmobacter welbionis]